MDPLSPLSQRILRFQGVQPNVLQALKPDRMKQDSQDLFNEEMDVFISRTGKAKNATVDLISHSKDAKSLHYNSGILRSLHRMVTGKDIQPVEIATSNPFQDASKPTVNGDIFQRSIRSDN